VVAEELTEPVVGLLAVVGQVEERPNFILHPQQRVMRMLLGLVVQQATQEPTEALQLSLVLQAVQVLEVLEPMILAALAEPHLLVAT
tara:strand:+ start:522 stop:782 length:261 start_codon:yes stop_codon:yes gene_type:complete